MNQQQKIQVTCPFHENQFVQYFCTHEKCQYSSLICMICLKENEIHNYHKQYLIDIIQLQKLSQDNNSKIESFINEVFNQKKQINSVLSSFIDVLNRLFIINDSELFSFNRTQIQNYISKTRDLEYLQKDINDISYITNCYINQWKDKIKNIKEKPNNDFTLTKEEEKKCENLYLQGDQLFKNHLYQDAIAQFNQVLEINPKHMKSLHYKAESLRQLGNYEDSILFYNRALEQNQEYQNSILGKCEALLVLGKNQEALSIYEKVVKKSPYNYHVIKGKCLQYYIFIGIALTNLGCCQDALQFLQEKMESDQNYPYVLYKIGDALKYAKNYSNALIYIDKALEIYPNNKDFQKLKQEIQQQQLIQNK